MNILLSSPPSYRFDTEKFFHLFCPANQSQEAPHNDISSIFTFHHTLHAMQIAEIRQRLQNWESIHPSIQRAKVVSRVLAFINHPSDGALDLSKLQIIELPDIFDLFPLKEKITTLDISSNHINNLPLSMNELKNLRNIIVNNNPITDISCFISKLTSLESIEAKNTQIEHLFHTQTFESQLKRIDVSGCKKLKTISQNLSNVDVIARDCDHFIAIIESMQKKISPEKITEKQRLTFESLEAKNLKKIVLEWSHSNTNHKKATKIIETFLANPCAMILDLQDCGLSTLPEIFTSSTVSKRLSKLILSRNPLVILPLGITSCKKLNEVCLLNNKMRHLPGELFNLPKGCILHFSSPYLSSQTLFEAGRLAYQNSNTTRTEYGVDTLFECLQKPLVQKKIHDWSISQRENGQMALLTLFSFLDNPHENQVILDNLDLTSLPDCFDSIAFKERCTSFNAAGNQLNELPPTFSSMKNLKVIELGCNDFVHHPAILNDRIFPNLEALSLRKNPLDAFIPQRSYNAKMTGLFGFSSMWYPTIESLTWIEPEESTNQSSNSS
ncbi:MAG: leucine-rich repeat domain-containing protein [Chlamydiae bacterium]|nr:leucine-rich repeat domain-containing protein [Chlamydiota bacterium]